MTREFKDWVSRLTAKERAGLFALAAILTGAGLFGLGVAAGEAAAAIAGAG